jgi:hypothetical protein
MSSGFCLSVPFAGFTLFLEVPIPGVLVSFGRGLLPANVSRLGTWSVAVMVRSASSWSSSMWVFSSVCVGDCVPLACDE